MSRRKRKFGMGKHTNIPKGLESSIENLANHENVTRTILGRFYPCKNKFPKGH